MLEAIQFLLYIAVLVFNVVCIWKIFQKANLPGWYSIIPIYGQYKFYDIAGKKKWYIALLIVELISLPICFGMIFYLIFAIANNDNASIALLLFLIFLMIVIGIFCFICNIVFAIGLAQRFNQGVVFAIGILLLPIVFYAILAFSDDMRYMNYYSEVDNRQYYTPENGYSSKLNINKDTTYNNGYTMSDDLNNPYNNQ